MRATPAVTVVSTFATLLVVACGSNPSAPPSDFYGTFQLQLAGGLPLPCESPNHLFNRHEGVLISGSLTLSPDGTFQRTEVREYTKTDGLSMDSTWTDGWVQEGTFVMKGRGSTRKLSMDPGDGWSFVGSVTEETVTLDDRISFGFPMWEAGTTYGGIYHFVR
jgi:hypothetical protein